VTDDERLVAMTRLLSASEGALATSMVDAGAEVVEFVGPVQHAVWSLTLRWGGSTVRFSVEQGISNGVYVLNPRMHATPPFTIVVYTFAVRSGARPTLTTPRAFVEAFDVDSWRDALDWVDTAAEEELASVPEVEAAWGTWVRASHSPNADPAAAIEGMARAAQPN
jgi:hypothetical protein